MGSIAGSPNPDASDSYTLQEMKELKKVATKDDIVQIKRALVAQSAEIQQRRGEIETQKELRLLKTMRDRG